MTLDSFRPKVAFIITPFAKAMVFLHLTPNACTVLALIAAAAAGIAFGIGETLLGVVLVFVSAFFDAIDGAVARLTGIASPAGDYLDHVFDRYADIFIITGIFAWGTVTWTSPVPAWAIGVFALTGVLMSSYLGTQAQAVGLKRNYGGILGRADRLVLILVFGVVEVLYPAPLLFGLPALGWLLLIFGVLGHITAIQRFATGWKELNAPARKE
ncbi:Phosphatidylinositol phosphate synthase [Methanocorpusculaceae archaeon Sp1]|uniref:Phosphatidylinositol phosphate synthase n=1 Tax=Methanorbis furvi TaxID=3028299 RepID=A0AAE4MFI7_9EURY|nr:Phosphatidylinositol phosphate synthase [Methanocorpusculaceae archaeon Sp1]MDV0442543.1 Phosphatidylinositol phosphate synthase [Methanocorpusculaceae archaeon Ag1]